LLAPRRAPRWPLATRAASRRSQYVAASQLLNLGSRESIDLPNSYAFIKSQQVKFITANRVFLKKSRAALVLQHSLQRRETVAPKSLK